MSTKMRIVALNVNHRTKHKPFPTGLTSNLLELEPDILILTEFVEAHLHIELRAQLHAAGLISMETSSRTEYSPSRFTNQVLIASRWPIEIVDLSNPAPDPHANSNILVTKTNGFIVAGLRAPWYPKDTAKNWRIYWEWICQNIEADIATGDFNFDPNKEGLKHQVPTELLQKSGWKIATPCGDWSYQGHTGAKSRIDHAMTRPGTLLTDVRYICEGIAPEYSDHAVLSMLAQTTESR